MCDEITDATKTVPTNFNDKNVTCETKYFYMLLIFLLIAIALLIAVSIYCYPIIYRTKQKHLLPYHLRNNKLKKICIIKCIINTESNYELEEINSHCMQGIVLKIGYFERGLSKSL